MSRTSRPLFRLHPRQPSALLRAALLTSAFRASTFLLAALPFAATVHAQSATNGAIVGTVSDPSGALLPEVTVRLVNNATGQERTVKTNRQGEYRATELEPGVYTETITTPGFQTFEESLIVVTVGSASNVSPKLALGNETSKVEVTDEAATLNTTGPEITTTLAQDAIDNLPINGRRWSSFALLTPGVVSNSDGFGLLSFRGISYLLNNSQIDGLDNNQAYFSEERGRTRASYSISQAAVQEFQVNTSNYSAEYGRAAGGVINTITKSGSNQFHGELFFYDRDNDFGASNPYTQLITQTPGTNSFVATNYKPKDWRKQWGFGVGGPIIKDKLFFFYSYDQSRRNFPGTARASDPSDTFAPADSVLPTGQTCASIAAATTLPAGVAPGDASACALATAVNLGTSAAGYQAGAAYYTQGLGVIASFLGFVPRTADQVLNFPRVDYQLNDRNRFTIEYNRLRDSSPAGVQTQASNFYGRSSFGNDFVKTDFGIFRYTAVLTNAIVNEFRAQYGRDFEYQTSQPPLPNELPLANNINHLAPDTQIGYEYDLQGFDIGTSFNGIRYAYPDERRLQGSDGITWSHGRHTTKFGVDINRVYEHLNNLYQGTGSYSYDFNWDFIADYLHQTTGLGGTGYNQQFFSYTQGFGNPSIAFSTTDYDGYISDDWRLTPRLTVNAGLRYEYEYVPANPYVNTGNNNVLVNGAPLPAISQTANKPDDRNNFGPRVGFALNVFGDGKTTLRGGYGLYYGRVIGANIGLAYQNSGGSQGQLSLTANHTNTCNIFPGVFDPSQSVGATAFANGSGGAASAGCAIRSPTVGFLDSHLQNPAVHEADLALEQDLGWKTVLGITYLSSFGRDLPSIYDINAPKTAGSVSTFTVRNDLSTTPGGGVTGTVLPRGGHKPPLLQNSVHTYKQYTGARALTAQYFNIYALQSESTSSYNALAIQLNKRFTNDLSFLSNFTFAHALDYNPYIGTGFGSSAFLPVDPQDRHQDYGNSNLNVNKRFVFAAHYNPHTHLRGVEQVLADGWGIAPIVQVQTGLPYSATTSGTQTGSALAGPLGAGGAARLPKYDAFGTLETERNIFNFPKTATLDVRLSKNINIPVLGERYRLEVFGEFFNVLNHQNITSVSIGSYTICKAVGTSNVAGGCPGPASLYSNGALLVYSPNFGTYKNANSNTLLTPRQLQLAARLHF